MTERFSARCHARVIWGGDETVRRVREAALPPRGVEVAFADRYSLLCIRPEAVTALSEEALERLAKDFYNDTYLTDQNACTSPRLIYWVGEGDSREASERFFRAVGAYARQRYELPAVTAVLLAVKVHPTTYWQLIPPGLIFVAVYAVCMWLFGLNRYERSLITAPLRRLSRR
mgnify:FL=1